MTDPQNDAFDSLAEFLYWTGITSILVMIVGAVLLLFVPDATLNSAFWPVLGVVASFVAFFGLYLKRRKSTVVVQKNNVVAGDLVGGDLVRSRGHRHVHVDLNELHATLERQKFPQTRPPEPLRRSDVSDQPWIDGSKKPTTRTKEQYSRSSDIRPAETYVPPATVYDNDIGRAAYADTDRCSSPSYDSGSSSSYDGGSCDSGGSSCGGGGGCD